MLLLKVIDMYYDFSQLVTNTQALINACDTLIKLNTALLSLVVCLLVWIIFTRVKK